MVPDTEQPLNVFLVEDSPVLTERIRELVDELPGVRLVACAEDESSAITALEQCAVDALILDLQLKKGTGFGVLQKLATMSHNPPARIVFTNYDLPEYRRRATRLGATHFLDKSRDYDQLVEILRTMGQARRGAAAT
jgi:DNA-binding NarL/FixJ family response regulator